MRTLFASLVASLGLIWVGGPAAAAVTVHELYYYPDTLSLYHDLGAQSLPAHFDLGSVLTDVTLGQIEVSGIPLCVPPHGCFWLPASFNGLELLYSRLTLTDVTIDPKTSVSGFDSSRVSFTSNEIWLNFQSLDYLVGDNVYLDVNSSVAEPSTWALMMLGFAGVGFLGIRNRRRRRRVRSLSEERSAPFFFDWLRCGSTGRL